MSNPFTDIIGINCSLPSGQQWFESRHTTTACVALTVLSRISVCSYPEDWAEGLLLVNHGPRLDPGASPIQ